MSSTWAHSPGTVRLDVVIPVGADATVLIPQEEQMTEITVREGSHVVWEDGHFIAGDPGVSAAERADARSALGITFHVGSGEYSFVLSGQ